MNSDRLIQMSSDIIVAGLVTKWSAAYSFLMFTWGTSVSDNGITFDSLSQTQFGKDLSYYLEPEDLFFMLLQAKDKFISISDGNNLLIFTESNVKQILINKWKLGITQLSATLTNIDIDNDYVSWKFSMLVGNTNENKESTIFSIKTVLSNYLEYYFKHNDIELIYPNITMKYRINWDTIKSRFSNRMSMNFGHCLFVQDDNEIKTIKILEKHRIYPVLDGSLSNICTFTSSDSNIAIVDHGGLITGISEGSCYITVVDSLYNISKQFNIKVFNHTLKLSSDTIYLYTGQLKKISSFVDGIKSNAVAYLSSNTNIVDVDTYGNLIGGGSTGSCTISVQDNLYGLVKKIKVHRQQSEFSLNILNGKNLAKGKTIQLVAFFNGEITKNVQYSSSDESLATVSSSGLITSNNISKDKKICTISATDIISGMTTSVQLVTYNFDIDLVNLIAYYSAVGRSNNDPNYSIWENQLGNGNNMIPYTNESQNTVGLFSNKASAGWQNGWFVFDSVSASNNGHWRIIPSPFLLTPNKNLVFAIRFKANYLSGYPSMFAVRSGTSSPSFSFYQSQAQNTFQFETGIYDATTKFTYVNAAMTDTTVVIQTISETLADVYINGVKTTSVKISKNSINNLFASVGAERQSSMGNFFRGAIKAIALYDVTSQLKTNAELIKLSQDLMNLS